MKALSSLGLVAILSTAAPKAVDAAEGWQMRLSSGVGAYAGDAMNVRSSSERPGLGVVIASTAELRWSALDVGAMFDYTDNLWDTVSLRIAPSLGVGFEAVPGLRIKAAGVLGLHHYQIDLSPNVVIPGGGLFGTDATTTFAGTRLTLEDLRLGETELSITFFYYRDLAMRAVTQTDVGLALFDHSTDSVGVVGLWPRQTTRNARVGGSQVGLQVSFVLLRVESIDPDAGAQLRPEVIGSLQPSTRIRSPKIAP
jgi:hypothetical protein